jgi:hypothetical protein
LLHIKSSAATRVLRTYALPAIVYSVLAAWALALDPALPPGSNFDLSHWKITFPDASASEKSPAQLSAGFTNQYCYTGADGAMVFWCPVNGGTTSGSSYPRSELRELINPADDNVNWTGYGTHVLTAQCKVTQQPPTSKKVIIGQIHGFNVDPLIKLQSSNGKIEALVKTKPSGGTDVKYTFATVGLNSNINYQIKVTEGVLTLTVNGLATNHNFFATNSGWSNQVFYFKAGNYCQEAGTNSTDGSVVMFYSLNVTHGMLTNPPAVITNSAAGAAGGFSFTVIGTTGSSYSIQASTNLTNWSPLVTNTATNGFINFVDTNSPTQGRRFYRARSS